MTDNKQLTILKLEKPKKRWQMAEKEELIKIFGRKNVLDDSKVLF